MLPKLCAIIAGICFVLGAFLLFPYHLANASGGVALKGSLVNPASSSAITTTLFLPMTSKDFVPGNPLWRFGSTPQRGWFLDYNPLDVASLRLGWYVDYGTSRLDTPAPYGMEYMPIVNVKQWKYDTNYNKTLCRVGPYYLSPADYDVSPKLSDLSAMVAGHPGLTWIVGNEPDRIDWGNSSYCAHQDEILPELYAQAYHDVYSVIKAADPTAQVAIAGLVEPTPLRLQYLERVWSAYQSNYGTTMPVDVWNIHGYIFRERAASLPDHWGADIPAGIAATEGMLYDIPDHKNFALLWQNLIALRTWMNSHGERNKPLIVTEYGVVFPDGAGGYSDTFTPPQVRDSFMYPSFNAFLNQPDSNIGMPADGNRLVQRWNWWSLDLDDGYCDEVNGVPVFFGNSNSYLFYSGLGPSAPPKNCPYPAKGRSPYFTYWTQYVQSLPASPRQPYSLALPAQPMSRSTISKALANTSVSESNCSDDPKIRSQLLQSLRNADDRLSAISKLTGGTKICLSPSAK